MSTVLVLALLALACWVGEKLHRWSTAKVAPGMRKLEEEQTVRREEQLAELYSLILDRSEAYYRVARETNLPIKLDTFRREAGKFREVGVKITDIHVIVFIRERSDVCRKYPLEHFIIAK